MKHSCDSAIDLFSVAVGIGRGPELPDAEDRGMTDSPINSLAHSNALSRMWGRWIWRMTVLITYAIWWGGISFYAAVVVPLGTRVIGSLNQGFVTQKVTVWHNGCLAVMVACLIVEAIQRRRRALWIVTGLLAVIELGLLWCHAKLTSQIDFQNHEVPPDFYDQHAVYLWLTTAEWVVGLSVPIIMGWLSLPRRDCHAMDSQTFSP